MQITLEMPPVIQHFDHDVTNPTIQEKNAHSFL